MRAPLFMARPLPGTVGETRRVVHLFRVPSDGAVPDRLTAVCGMTFGPGELELLDGPRGMSCESCLRFARWPRGALDGSGQ
ncbi:MAG: hypothetical protein ACRDRN_17455 [Sciscionella sp.]